MAAIVGCSIGLAGCSASPDSTDTSEVAPSSDVTAIASRRAAHTATNLPDGSVMVVGGCVVDGCEIATDSVLELAPDGSISSGPAMSTPRAGHVALPLPDGSVFVAGGFSGEGQLPLATTEIRRGDHPWESSGEMRLGRGGNAAALLGNGSPIIIGGWLGQQRYTATTEILDLESHSFASGPNLPEPLDGLAAVTLKDGSVLVTGGQARPGVATGMAVLISDDGHRVSQIGPLSEPRFKHTMVVLPSGEALVIGGTSDDRELLASTELYDPTTKTFRKGPRLINPRYKLAGSAAVLPDGRVVVGGGGIGVELVHPDSNSSVLLAPFTRRTSSFATINLLGDDIINIGGYDERIQLTNTFERVSVTDL